MKHASLFSGIGGFDLAAEWAGWTNVFNCEIDKFCQKVLRYHFPNAIQYEDIKSTDFAIHRGGWMSSREDSPANRSALQAKEEARMITATSGRRCCEQFAKYNRVGSWAKMFSELLIGRTEWYSSRCALIWRLRATKSSRFLFRLVLSMRHTDEIECGLSPENGMLPTVVTQGLKYCNEKGQSAFVKAELLPTPTTNDSTNYTIPPSQAKRDNLLGYILRGMLPTPCANEGQKGQKKFNRKSQNGMALTARMANHMLPGEYLVGEHSRLNPLFVAEMMGFPPDWTLAPFLNGCEVAEDSDSADTGEENPSKPTGMP